MAEPDRPSYADYPAWARAQLDVDWTDPRYRRHYESNATTALTSVQSHVFFQNIEPTLHQAASQYNPTKPQQLLTKDLTAPHLHIKPFESVMNKSYRLNVLKNSNYPEEPASGWCVPSTAFTQLNDIIRGLIVCRYIDGTALVARTLHTHANALALPSHFGSRQNDAGYYAFHFYVSLPVQISDMRWNPVEIPITIELQLTTQLQEVLKDLTHSFYEETRLQCQETNADWKWQFETPRFKGSYIGHTLHLLEGIIVSLKTEVQAAAGAAPDDDQI